MTAKRTVRVWEGHLREGKREGRGNRDAERNTGKGELTAEGRMKENRFTGGEDGGSTWKVDCQEGRGISRLAGVAMVTKLGSDVIMLRLAPMAGTQYPLPRDGEGKKDEQGRKRCNIHPAGWSYDYSADRPVLTRTAHIAALFNFSSLLIMHVVFIDL